MARHGSRTRGVGLLLGLVLVLGAMPAGGATLGTVHQFGSTGSDTALGIAARGIETFVVGVSDGGIDGAGHGGTDVFVRRSDAAGDEVSTIGFGTVADDTGRAIAAVSPSGPIVVAGDTDGSMPGQQSHGGRDAFVREMRASGTPVWTRQLGLSSDDTANGVAFADRSVYATGSVFVVRGGIIGQQAVLWKFRPNGELAWSDRFGDAGADDVGYAVTAAPDGGAYVVGCFNDCRFGSIDEPNQAFVRRYRPDGDVAWQRVFGSVAHDEAFAVAAGAGGVFVGGQTSGTLAGQTSAGGIDGFVRRFRADGESIWTTQFGTSAKDTVTGLARCGLAFCASGWTRGTFEGQTSAGSADAFVRTFGTGGALISTLQFGTTEFDAATDIAMGSDIWVVGGTDGTFGGQTSAGDQDAYLALITT